MKRFVHCPMEGAACSHWTIGAMLRGMLTLWLAVAASIAGAEAVTPSCLASDISPTALRLSLQVGREDLREQAVTDAILEQLHLDSSGHESRVVEDMVRGLVVGVLRALPKQDASSLRSALYDRLAIYCSLTKGSGGQDNGSVAAASGSRAKKAGSIDALNSATGQATVSQRLDELFDAATTTLSRESTKSTKEEKKPPDYDARAKKAVSSLEKLEYVHRQIMSCSPENCASLLAEAFDGDQEGPPGLSRLPEGR